MWYLMSIVSQLKKEQYGIGIKINRGSVSTWRGGMGREMGGRFKREGTYVHLRLIHVDV